ncbi:hypothetical protein [Methylobacterium iners]|nr:hypothetical protein [Methylobacterium iners]
MAAFWLAVIATIAVLGLPSSALAHQGHRHGLHDGGHGHSAPADIRHGRDAKVSRAMTAEAATLTTEADAPGESLACTGPCCGAGGHCCAGGLVPEAGAGPFADRSGGPALARDPPARLGIVPEALPEPPRSFA